MRRIVVRSLLLSLIAGCAEVPEGATHDLESVDQAILNGTAIAERDSGNVLVGGGCSGTLMRNRWVLTAAHCVNLHLDRAYRPNGSFVGVRDGVEIEAAIADSSGRLILAGYVTSATLGDRFYLTRFTAAGAVDTTFGTSGEVISDFSSSSGEQITDIAIQSDGKIVVAGEAIVSGSKQFALARYTTAGALDATYDGDGKVLTDFASSTEENANAVTLDSSGRAIAAGTAVIGGFTQFALARYTTAGVLDTTFDGDGKVLTNFPSSWFNDAYDVAVDGSGKIVAVGTHMIDTVISASVARYNANGSLDTTFSSDGMTIVSDSTGDNWGKSVLIQGTKILVGGERFDKASVWRLTSAGALDSTFGSSGRTSVEFFDQTSGIVEQMAFAADGRIRLGAAVSTNADGLKFGYSALSANGATTADRVFPEDQGMTVGGGATRLSAIAVSGTRVWVAGTRNPSTTTSRSAFIAMQPDRTTDTAFNSAISVEMDGQVIGADRALLSTSNDDVALLRLTTGMTMNGSATGYSHAGFFGGVYANLPGTNVTCRGYGNSAIDAAGNQSGFGVLRTGTSRVANLATVYLGLNAVPSPATAQLPLRGDSGTSCTSGGRIVGVQSRGNNSSAWMVRADRFSAWVNTQVANP